RESPRLRVVLWIAIMPTHRRARLPMALLVAAALVGCQLPVQQYPYHDVGAAPLMGASVPASDRDDFQKWTIERVVELRKHLGNGHDTPDPQAQEICRELEEAAIDWKTFLV